ncbi:MAG: beta-ketoacyl-ACP synthase III [Erysipelotrichales bacterium]
MKAKFIGSGSYYPSTIVKNTDLEKVMDTNDEWIYSRTGIRERRYSNKNTSFLAYKAAKDAIENSEIDKNEIDLIIVATFSADYSTPSCANQVKAQLELNRDIPVFDINAACSGFVYGLNIVQAFIKAEMYLTVLLVGAENISKHLDFNDRASSILFGDGAGACLFRGGETGIIDSIIYSQDDVNEAILVSNGVNIDTPFTKGDIEFNSRLKMKGQEVFKFATKACLKVIKEILEKNELSLEDIDYIVPHQANQRIIDYVQKVLGIENNKIITNLAYVGNTSAASIPLVLDELNKADKLKKGNKILFVAFGSGLSYGAALLEI